MGPAVIAAPARAVSLNPAYAGFVGAVWRARSLHLFEEPLRSLS